MKRFETTSRAQVKYAGDEAGIENLQVVVVVVVWWWCRGVVALCVALVSRRHCHYYNRS